MRSLVPLSLIVSFALMPLPVWAAPATQDAAPATHPATLPTPLSREEFERLVTRTTTELEKHLYDKAAADCRLLLAADPKNAAWTYNLACALARLGQSDDALTALHAAIDLGFVDADHIQQDDDLASLHGQAKFTAEVARARVAEKNAPYEKGEDIKGVKTIEDFPDGGLRYRLRMSPDATAQKPDRLIIWLHPSGGSADKVVERLAPALIQRGFALVVFTRKQYMGWTSEEANQLINGTLPALAKIPGIDARKPILMGFSAGGQMALELYFQNPGQFGGLILNSAYPFDMQTYLTQRKVMARPLPKDPSIKEVPILSIVGEADGGSRVWKQIEHDWQTAGVPLSVIYVPKQPHTFLIRGAQLPIVEDWLSQVAAGKKPMGMAGAHPSSAPASSTAP